MSELLRDPGWTLQEVVRPDGTRLNVGTLGRGRPILLVHGYGASIGQ